MSIKQSCRRKAAEW